MFKNGMKLHDGTIKTNALGFMYFIVPLTGWSSNYKYPFGIKSKTFIFKYFS